MKTPNSAPRFLGTLASLATVLGIVAGGAAVLELVPTAQAANCLYNVASSCTGNGTCQYNLASSTCSDNASCKYNIGATCSGSGDCDVNVAGTCRGTCDYNIASTCDGNCKFNILLSTCDATSECYLNAALSQCRNYGDCTYNIGSDCNGGRCPVNVVATCTATGEGTGGGRLFDGTTFTQCAVNFRVSLASRGPTFYEEQRYSSASPAPKCSQVSAQSSAYSDRGVGDVRQGTITQDGSTYTITSVRQSETGPVREITRVTYTPEGLYLSQDYTNAFGVPVWHFDGFARYAAVPQPDVSLPDIVGPTA